jgi:AraC family transcriptional regulator
MPHRPALLFRCLDDQPQVVECGALGFASASLFGELAVPGSADVQICVPLGRDCVDVATNAGWLEGLEVQPGEAAVVPAGRELRVMARTLTPIVMMWLDEAFIQQEAGGKQQTRVRFVEEFAAQDPYLHRLASVMKAGQRAGEAQAAGYMRGIAPELAIYLATAYGRIANQSVSHGLSPRRLERALLVIEERLCDSLLVDELAREVNMSPFHFSRMFKSSMGQSPHFYITLRRVERAKEMLAGSDLSLAKVSEALGYATQAHFTGVFRTHAGTTPRAYRIKFGSARP